RGRTPPHQGVQHTGQERASPEGWHSRPGMPGRLVPAGRRLRLHNSPGGTAWRKQGDAEAAVGALVRRPGPVAERRAAVPADAAPAAATDHPVRAFRAPRRVAQRADFVVALAIPVGAPLPHVPVHVVQPESVWLVRAYLARVPQVSPRIVISVGVFTV